MITKEMLNLCQNELKQAFCALEKDIQSALIENTTYAQSLNMACEWVDCKKIKGESFHDSIIYRLSPDTPTEPEYVDSNVVIHDGTYSFKRPTDKVSIFLFAGPCSKRFLGIIYTKDGIETLRTSVDAAFGTPVRVRFSK